MEVFLGGGNREILRDGEFVRRPAGPWSATVHRLLSHVRAHGFDRAPFPVGFSDSGEEILTFLPGTVSNYPLPDNVRSEAALISAARLLRSYHDATADFLHEGGTWQLKQRSPVEVVCHGDYAPYNVVFDGTNAVGIIDFDAAHPGPRTWDIAYALYRWAPFTNPHNTDGFGTPGEQIARARRFCDAYGLEPQKRRGLAEMVAERLRQLLDFLVSGAEAGIEAFRNNMQDGHHLLYQRDIEYIEMHRQGIDSGLYSGT
ncbi:MAG TPA: aminoglycoside phosphotransferase family protein [Spirochaetia bacterium]|nr:aminoglycoside phosphotransferase family protein [Spirochaetia bacterium]